MRKLTKRDVALMLTLIADNYNKEIPSEDVFNAKVELTYNRLSKYPYEIVNEALGRCFDDCKYCISIADIKEHIDQMQNATNKTEYDLWAELDRAIYDACILYGRFGYTAIPIGETKSQGQLAREQLEILFNSLDPIIKDYLHDKQGLINIIDCNIEYEKGRFLKAIPNLRHRQEILRETPNNILKELNNAFKSIDDVTKPKEIDIYINESQYK